MSVDQQRLVTLQCLFVPHYRWHEIVAHSPLQEEDTLGPHEPSLVLSHGKETEHGSTGPHA